MSKTINRKFTMVLNATKTHSVRYDPRPEDKDDCPLSAIYIRKDAYDGSGSFPQEVTITLES